MAPSSSSSERPSATNKRWLIRQISIFSDLPEAHLDFVADRCRVVEYEKDALVYAQGDPPDSFFGLVSGRARVFVSQAASRSETLEILHRGDYFGMISLLTNEPHSVTVQALNDCILIKVHRPEFEAILKHIPKVAIHLSTTLSRRLRQKDIPAKKVFESTIVSIYSPLRKAGSTMYAINLAASLHQETGKRAVLLDISARGDSVCNALGVARCPLPLRLKGVGFDQSKVTSAIVKHPAVGFDTLNIAHDPNVTSDVTQITPLLSYLANLYHFVIVDLPHELDRTVFKAMVQADFIHLLSKGTRPGLESAVKVLAELQSMIQQAETRVRVILNEMEEEVHETERAEILRYKVYATLPKVAGIPAPGHPITLAQPDWSYARAVRRVSREIGEVLVGLVLGSGAAMGLSHIGVLRVLEREKIPIDILAGSSIGALIGSFWASGLNSKDLEEIALEFRTKRSLLKLIDPYIIPKFGIFRGAQVTHTLQRQLGDKTFRDLKLPVKITACDYTRRELVVLDEGSVIQAVRASVSIPAIFVPVKIRGRYLIDGGVLAPVPVEVLSRMGVHKIIAVNTLPSPQDLHRRGQEIAEERARLRQEARMRGWHRVLQFRLREAWWNWVDTNVFDVIMHTMQGMEYVLAEAQCAQADVALHPTIPRVNWWEFYNVDELIQRGVQETEAHLDEIKKLVSE